MHDRRLPGPQLLAEVAGRYGVLATDLHLVRNVQNAIYSYERDGRCCFLRLTDALRKGCEEVAGELDWLRYLTDRGLPVCQPVPSQRGRLVETLSAGGEAFWAVAFEKVRGQPVAADDMKPALFEAFGQLMGRLHAMTKDYRPASSEMRRPDWFNAHGLNRDLEHLPAEQAAVKARVRELVEFLRVLPRDRSSYGLVHGDMGFSNCHVDDGQLHLFDFDHCEYGYFASDIGAAIYECAIHVPAGGAEKVAKFWPTFWAGYRRENALDPTWLQRIPEFIRLRDAWIYVHFHRIHDMPQLMAREERIRRDFAAWRQRIENGIGPVDTTFA